MAINNDLEFVGKLIATLVIASVCYTACTLVKFDSELELVTTSNQTIQGDQNRSNQIQQMYTDRTNSTIDQFIPVPVPEPRDFGVNVKIVLDIVH